MRQWGKWAGLLAVMALAVGWWLWMGRPRDLKLTVSRQESPFADGYSVTEVRLRPGGGKGGGVAPRLVVNPARMARIERQREVGEEVVITLRHGVLPGEATLRAEASGYHPGELRIALELYTEDTFGDGTPDLLRLTSREDQKMFRRWFAALAEGTSFLEAKQLPREINDCAALLRFAYREALREHGPGWQVGTQFPPLGLAGSVRKYNYPYTPLRGALFRVREGRFGEGELTDGAWAEFADANTIRRFNTHWISRQWSAAQPGDLFFYRQLEQNLPYHTMIFLGDSPLTGEAGPWIVYHTGPVGEAGGEMRRVTLRELLNHPSPRWRPEVSNPNFLGVYRWNILRESN